MILCLQEREILAEKAQAYLVLHDKIVKGLKERNTVQKFGGKWWKIKILQRMAFLTEHVVTENIMKSSCSEKLISFFLPEILTKYL